MTVDGSSDSIAHEGLSKIQQAAEFQAGKTEVCEQLLLVGRSDALDGLQLNDDFAFNDEVGAKAFTERLPLVFRLAQRPAFAPKDHAVPRSATKSPHKPTPTVRSQGFCATPRPNLR